MGKSRENKTKAIDKKIFEIMNLMGKGSMSSITTTNGWVTRVSIWKNVKEVKSSHKND